MYGNIKEADLDIPCLYDGYEQKLRTIRECLDDLCLDEEIEYANYMLANGDSIGDVKVTKFTAWTESYVVAYSVSMGCTEYFVKFDRNPPKNLSY
jgi:hypothetical protein